MKNLIRADAQSCSDCPAVGAMIAFSGIENCAKIIHGGPGCASQIRRSIIQHFHEPVEIETSAVSDAGAVMGGEAQLKEALGSSIARQRPGAIGIATTCLTETIGDDIAAILGRSKPLLSNTPAFFARTPSYKENCAQGFRAAASAIARQIELSPGIVECGAALIPGMLSPADLRFLKRETASFGLDCLIFPDYSETLDGPIRPAGGIFAPGGTTPAQLRSISSRRHIIEFSGDFASRKNRRAPEDDGPGSIIARRSGARLHRIGAPIGVEATDRFYDLLSSLTGVAKSRERRNERGRLIDSYLDASPIISGKRIGIAAGPDLTPPLALFAKEIGAVPLILSAADSLENADFDDSPDLLLGDSRLAPLAKRLKIPLARIGFPIFDRFGGQRLLSLGYAGSQHLFDAIINSLMDQPAAGNR